MKRFIAFLTFAFALCLTACGSAPKLPTTPQLIDARHKAAIVVAISEQGLEAIATGAQQAADVGILKPDDAKVVDAALVDARSILTEAHAWIDGTGVEPTRERVLLALDRVEQALKLVRAAGVKVPAVTDRALKLARELVTNKLE